VGSVCHVKQFTIGLKNSLMDVLKTADDAWPVNLVELATKATTQWVEELIWSDRRITIDSVATALRCSHGLAYRIMLDLWKFWKVRAWWVPRE
jgi:hypothetical protein